MDGRADSLSLFLAPLGSGMIFLGATSAVLGLHALGASVLVAGCACFFLLAILHGDGGPERRTDRRLPRRRLH